MYFSAESIRRNRKELCKLTKGPLERDGFGPFWNATTWGNPQRDREEQGQDNEYWTLSIPNPKGENLRGMGMG